MDTLEEKVKQFKHAKAIGQGYPYGYKSSVNAYMSGYNSGRFDAYKRDDFIKNHQEVNKMVQMYHKLVQQNWEVAKCKIVIDILNFEAEIRRTRLLYGMDAPEFHLLREKIAVLEFMCDALPRLEDKHGQQ